MADEGEKATLWGTPMGARSLPGLEPSFPLPSASAAGQPVVATPVAAGAAPAPGYVASSSAQGGASGTQFVPSPQAPVSRPSQPGTSGTSSGPTVAPVS